LRPKRIRNRRFASCRVLPFAKFRRRLADSAVRFIVHEGSYRGTGGGQCSRAEPEEIRINALHIFTAVTVVSLWAGLTGIRRGDVRAHAGSMVGLYVGGLIIAGLFAFIPGRTMWQVVFGG
jgi:hypothetical protein